MKMLKLTLGCCLLSSLALPALAIEEITNSDAPSATAPVVTNAHQTNLTFMDSKLFDGKLARELESGKDSVEISISGRMPLNNIPGRIDRWLVVAAEEGSVETVASPPRPTNTRALFTVVPMLFNAFGYLRNIKDEKLYDTAKPYDAKIYYRKDENGDSLIDKIVLIKRKAAAR